MSNKFIFMLIAVPFGLYCLAFTAHAAKIISLLSGVRGQNQSSARPAFIRLVGIINIGLALFVYFGFFSVK